MINKYTLRFKDFKLEDQYQEYLTTHLRKLLLGSRANFGNSRILHSFFSYLKNQREQFKLRYINDQWENIFLTLVQDKYLIFDYDQNSFAFNFRNQKNFYRNICDTTQLRDFLRAVRPIKESVTLEQHLHNKLNKNTQVTHDIDIETQQIEYGKAQIASLKISISQGVRPIIVIQYQGNEMAENFMDQFQRQDEQQVSKQFILKKLIQRFIVLTIRNSELDFIKFKKYWISQLYKEYRNSLIYSQQDLVSSNILIIKLLNGIKKLYPKRDFEILNPDIIICLQNNKLLLSTIIMYILEKIVSPQIKIELIKMINGDIQITFSGFFNYKSLELLSLLTKKYNDFIPSIAFKLFQIQVIVANIKNEESQELVLTRREPISQLTDRECLQINQDLKNNEIFELKRENGYIKFSTHKSDKQEK